MDCDIFEGLAKKEPKCRRSKLLDVFSVVAPVPHVFPSAEIPQPKVGLPWYGHDTTSAADAGELWHRALGRSQVLQYLEACDDTGATVDERQHSGIGSYAGHGKSLESDRELVLAKLDSDKRPGSNLHRLQSEPLANTDIDPSTGCRTCKYS